MKACEVGFFLLIFLSFSSAFQPLSRPPVIRLTSNSYTSGGVCRSRRSQTCSSSHLSYGGRNIWRSSFSQPVWSLNGEEERPTPEINPAPRDPDEPPEPAMPLRHSVVSVTGEGMMDVPSRLLKDRIILIGEAITDEVANVVVAELLCLANSSPEDDITMYINSPGGSVTSGMAIFDAMEFIPCDVSTVCFGTAASMGAFLLAAGARGKRRALPNARIMIHQPLGAARGQAADIEIQAKEILFTRAQINGYLSSFTGQPVDKIEADCDRDFFLSASQAVDYGLIDEVVKTKTSHFKLPAPSSVLL